MKNNNNIHCLIKLIFTFFVIFSFSHITVSKSSSTAKYHTVKKGETLYSISRKYGIDIDYLCKTNKISKSKPLYAGRKLVIKKQSSPAGKAQAKNQSAKSVSTKNLHFNWPVKKVNSVHRDGNDGVKSIGIIIKTTPGTSVYSAENGTVQKIGYMRGFGNYVVMKHDERFMTVYANLDSVSVKGGQKVGKGAPIGRIAQNNSSIHFQINCAGKALDALTILPPRG